MFGPDNPWGLSEHHDDIFDLRTWSWPKFVTIAAITFLVLVVVIG